MAVAKSFVDLEIKEGPYVAGGKQYVKVLTKAGTLRQVRWYSDAEYRQLYGSDPEIMSFDVNLPPVSQRKVLGFGALGYITIFKGDTYQHLDWFRASNARFARPWGWYIVSEEPIPEDLPEDLTPIQLPWELVGDDETLRLKNDEEVKAAVESLLFEPTDSEFVGEIKERLDLYVTVERAIPLENAYGYSTMHIMRDEDGNEFVWTTQAKTWEAGSEKHIRGTVKDHKVYRNSKQTILTRCMEVK